MANKKMKWFSIATLACAASLCIGFGAANVTADAAATFAITATSVRTNDPSGLRFKVDVPEGAEVENAFTRITLTTSEGEDYTTDVPTTVYRADGGWNAVLLDIPESDYVTEVTAQAFATINGEACETVAHTSSIAKTALKAYSENLATMGDVKQYIQFEEETTETYTFANYTAGTAYADNEEHQLDDYVSINTTDCHFTSELRLYNESAAAAIIKCEGVATNLIVNAGYKTAILKVYGSNDKGKTWIPINEEISVSTSYEDKTITLNDEYQQIKLVPSGAQIRVKYIKLTYKQIPLTDEVKATNLANKVADSLVVDEKVKEAGTVIQLPTTEEEGATVTWSMVANEYATLDVATSKVTITKLPDADSVELALTATITATVGTATSEPITKNGVITVQSDEPASDAFPQIGKAYYMSAKDTTKYANSYITGVSGNGKYLTVGAKSSAITVTFEAVAGTTDQYYIKLSTGQYIESRSSGNEIYADKTTPNDACKWKVTVADDGSVTITSVSYSTFKLQYNASSPRISRYSTAQQPIAFELA